jgi:DUF917 family protein
MKMNRHIRVKLCTLVAMLSAAWLSSAAVAQQSVNKCIVGGKTVYQSQPCPSNTTKEKKVDTSGKSNAQLGKDFSQQAAKDKEKLAEIDKARKAKEAQERGDELGMSPQPKVRNLALERIEKALSGKKP